MPPPVVAGVVSGTALAGRNDEGCRRAVERVASCRPFGTAAGPPAVGRHQREQRPCVSTTSDGRGLLLFFLSKSPAGIVGREGGEYTRGSGQQEMMEEGGGG